jgi:ubiquinone/menaquinone biosynthesis C-methylase UbiE
MRERVYEKEKQTSFAKNHSVLGSKCLLTDIDAIQSTENEFYNEYWYENGKPILKRLIEVKYKPTEYIKRQIKRINRLNTQTQMFSYLIYEINQFRKLQNLPLAEFYYIIQTNGEMPYYVYNVVGINSELKFEYKGKVKNIFDYKTLFNY